MAPKTRSRESLEAELEFLRQRRAVDGITSVANTFVRWAGISTLGVCTYLSLDVLAGKSTDANIAISVLQNFKSTGGGSSTIGWVLVLAPWALAGACILYGLAQRRLRRDTVERLQGRILVLEKTVDPDRTSSSLTVRGETRKEDQT